MESSPLSKLPPELREHIYNISLYQPGGIVFATVYGGDLLRSRPRLDTSHALALTQTCRAIRAECAGIFFNVNRVYVPGDTTFGPAVFFGKALEILGQSNADALREVKLSVEDDGYCFHEKMYYGSVSHWTTDRAEAWPIPEMQQQLIWLRQWCLAHPKANVKLSVFGMSDEVPRDVWQRDLRVFDLSGLDHSWDCEPWTSDGISSLPSVKDCMDMLSTVTKDTRCRVVHYRPRDLDYEAPSTDGPWDDDRLERIRLPFQTVDYEGEGEFS